MAELVAVAADLIGAEVELLEDLSFSSRARVARLRLADGSTVVVKRPEQPSAYMCEAAAFATIPAEFRPGLVVAGQGVIVMEDLGAGTSLADLLLGEDRAAAEGGLLAWSYGLGRALRPTLRRGADEQPENLQVGVDHLEQLATDLDIVSVPEGLRDEADFIAAVLGRPGSWLAFCPGDTCPDNNRVGSDNVVRFFDFEGAGWRHAAMEAAYCRSPFCTCWCVARLPDEWAERMEEAFVDALAPPDRQAFVRTIGLAAAGYTLSTLGWFRSFLVENNRVGPPDRAPLGGRQYVYNRLNVLVRCRDELPALAALANDVTARLVDRWPEAAEIPLYPAFT